MGNIIELFDPTATPDEVSEGIKRLLTNISIIAGVLWVTAYFQYAFLQHMSEKLSFTLRGKYLDSLMRQETAYFEKQKVESIPSQIQEYFSAISNGSGEKVGQILNVTAMFFSGLAIAFWKGPIFTLVCMAFIPMMMMVFAVFGGLVKKAQVRKFAQIEALGSHTEETLSAMKLVVSFAQEGLTIQKYDEICE